ncbi:MAG TPA: hypothetical protein VGB55_07465 [Tepidisphaeraceae bacterium]
MSWNARVLLWLVIACGAAIVAAGVDWGLPSTAADRYLFASHEPWTGAELAAFDPARANADLGADVDRDPLDRTGKPLVLNGDDAQRAEIVRRYRLYSEQPDEMITFMALQQMSPGQGDFDPRLYQYGGLWIYPVGGLLKGLSVLGLIELRPDVAFYYDHPRAFGKFYIVARLYTLAWTMILMATAAVAAKRLTGNDAAAVGAAAVALALPVTFAMAHEAKPHLAGAALMLLACLGAHNYVKRGRIIDALLCGAAIGLAAGMVLSAAVIGVLLPAVLFVRRGRIGATVVALLLATLSAALAYGVTNPYVVLHLASAYLPMGTATDVNPLTSNLGNSTAMYQPGPLGEMLRDGTQRLIDAATLPVLLLAAVAVLVGITLAIIKRRSFSSLTILLAAPTMVVLLQFFLLAAGKPGEYARFALFPAVVLALAGVWAIDRVPWRGFRYAGLTIWTALIVIVGTLPYFEAFSAHVTHQSTRQRLAARLQDADLTGALILDTPAEPAPYSLPPVDLWRWQLRLSDTAGPATEIFIRAVDHPNEMAREGVEIFAADRPAPITWANKPFVLSIKPVR